MAEADIDVQRIDDMVLALMHLTLHDHRDGVARAWKGFDWNSLDRLKMAGFIADPAGRARSVLLTPEGVERSQRLFESLFVIRNDAGSREARSSQSRGHGGKRKDDGPEMRLDPLIAELAGDGWLSARTVQCLLRIPAHFPHLGIAPDEAATSLRISHVAPLSSKEVLPIRNVSAETCREIALVIERLGWSGCTHADHPFRTDAVGATSGWIERFDKIVEQRKSSDKRALSLLKLKDEGLTNAEIGKKEGISPARVGQLLRRARSA